MSSTKRGSTRSPLDFYRTPAWCVRALWATWPDARRVTKVYDPACGDGAILLALRDMEPTLTLFGSDVDQKRVDEAQGRGLLVAAFDYLGVDWSLLGEDLQPPAIIMNPPYSQAEAFVRRALLGPRLRPVAALLRIAFLSSQGREAWLRWDAPDVYVLPRRPDFTGGGGDRTDYAWMVWPEGPSRTLGTIQVIPLAHCQDTPEEEAEMKARKAALREAEAAIAAAWPAGATGRVTFESAELTDGEFNTP